jgi:hypothetical protein
MNSNSSDQNSETPKSKFFRWIITSLIFGLVWGIYKGGLLPGVIGGTLFFVRNVMFERFSARFKAMR